MPDKKPVQFCVLGEDVSHAVRERRAHAEDGFVTGDDLHLLIEMRSQEPSNFTIIGANHDEARIKRLRIL